MDDISRSQILLAGFMLGIRELPDEFLVKVTHGPGLNIEIKFFEKLNNRKGLLVFLQLGTDTIKVEVIEYLSNVFRKAVLVINQIVFGMFRAERRKSVFGRVIERQTRNDAELRILVIIRYSDVS